MVKANTTMYYTSMAKYTLDGFPITWVEYKAHDGTKQEGWITFLDDGEPIWCKSLKQELPTPWVHDPAMDDVIRLENGYTTE